MIESATGLILRTRPLTDTSLIVSWLTPELGRVATVAKGARRPKSPFAGKLDLFYRADFTFQRSRRSELHQLREVSLLDTHAAIRRDLACLHQAAYAAALIEQATETDTPVAEIHELMAGLLNHLAEAPPQPQTIPAFELKLLDALGLQPDSAREKLPPDLAQILKLLGARDWSTVARLKLTKTQFARLSGFLQGFLVFHLGRVPGNRASALAGQAP
jgi:DNA repair protein RecO (recombination protein O)